MSGISDILQSGSLAYTKPSPASVAARRALAQQLLEGSRIQNAGPLGALANALGGFGSAYGQASAAQQEQQGQDSASSALADALKNGGTFDSLSSVASNPWLSDSQSGIVNALLGKEIDQRYPQLTANQSDYMFGKQHPDFMQSTVDPLDSVEGRAQLADQYGLQGDDRTRFILTKALPGGNANVRAGVGQPIYGRNKVTGAVEPWQSMTDGSMVNIANPQANPSDYDFNPGVAASERTGATVDAKSAAAARAALPGAQQALDIANKATNALLGDTAGMADQFGSTMGIPHQKMGIAFPGSDMARFRTELEQGAGQAFMQARQMLKGGGPITDFEGAKAEAAFSRMTSAAYNNNQDEFIAAVRDFQQAVNEGYQNLQAAAQGDYAAGGAGITAGGGGNGNVTSSGVQWSVEP